MQNDGIKKLVETRYGKNIAFSNECEELSLHIKKSIQAIISPQTLRRLLGFIDDDVQPSKRTLHYISMYCGFQNFQELEINLIYNEQQKTIQEMVKGDSVQVEIKYCGWWESGDFGGPSWKLLSISCA